MELAGKILMEFGGQALKQFRRHSAFQRLLKDKQLVVVSPGHWLFAVICSLTRTDMEEATARIVSIDKKPLEDRAAYGVSKLLANSKHVPLSSIQQWDERSQFAYKTASIYSALLPEYEPLLVQVALTHTLREWSHAEGSSTNAADFDAALRRALAGPEAQNWFNCQFFINNVQLLSLAPFFYKTHIANNELRDLISKCVVEGQAGSKISQLLFERLAKEKNKAALDAWVSWVGEEFAECGSPRRVESGENITSLRPVLINSHQLQPTYRAYFPFGMKIECIGSKEFSDHCGVLYHDPSGGSIFRPGFIYSGSS